LDGRVDGLEISQGFLQVWLEPMLLVGCTADYVDLLDAKDFELFAKFRGGVDYGLEGHFVEHLHLIASRVSEDQAPGASNLLSHYNWRLAE